MRNSPFYDDELNQAVMPVIADDVPAALTVLKQQPGQGIMVGASGTLLRYLL